MNVGADAYFTETHMPTKDPHYQYLKFVKSSCNPKVTLGGALALDNAQELASATSIDLLIMEKQIAVLAKVSDLEAWSKLPRIRHGMNIATKKNWIVTARIPMSYFEELHNLPFVKRLEVASTVQPLLNRTITDIGLKLGPQIIPSELLEQKGQHVVIGIVDRGCDFAHKNFIKPTQKTRIHAIWHQGAKLPDGKQKSNKNPFRYGKIYTRKKINKALQNSDPCGKLGYRPTDRHGTLVMDIAAGSGLTPGVAPKAKIIFVDISHEKDGKLQKSDRLAEAVQYIFGEAEKKGLPCVVNLSLCINTGPHDGISLTVKNLNALVKKQLNRAIVIGAGNEYTTKSHFSGQVSQGKTVEIKWNVDNRKTHNKLEVWYSGEDEFEIQVFHNFRFLKRFPLGSEGPLIDSVYASHEQHPCNRDNCFVQDGNPQKGFWMLKLYGKSIRKGGDFMLGSHQETVLLRLHNFLWMILDTHSTLLQQARNLL